MKYYYKVLFYDRYNNDYYLLGYTSNKKVYQAYYKKQGYSAKDIIFLKLNKEVKK